MDKQELLNIRKKLKSKKPAFIRQSTHKVRRLQNKIRWRRPHGYQSKVQRGIGHKKMVSPGYGSPSLVRALDRKGFAKILIFNVKDLEKVNKKEEGIVVSATVALKNKIAILQKAVDLKIKVLNIKEPEKFIEKVKLRFDKKKEEKVKVKEVKKQKEAKKEEKKESIEDKLSDEEKKKLEKKEIDRLLTKKF
ncbi:MAG: eL32 family ribosomal protein [archaeon]